jgi:hypothetical protein
MENLGVQGRKLIRDVSESNSINYFGLSMCDGISTSRVESLMKKRMSLRRIRGTPTDFRDINGKLFVHTYIHCYRFNRSVDIQSVVSLLRIFIGNDVNDFFDIGIQHEGLYINYSDYDLERKIEEITDNTIADYINAHLEGQ